MNRWHRMLALATAITIAGCRSPHGVEELKRELRYQEDMIYTLQDYIQTYKSHLDSCRTENRQLSDRSGSFDGPSGTDSLPSPNRDDDTEFPDGEIRPPQIILPEVSQLEDNSNPSTGEPSDVDLSNDTPMDDIIRIKLDDETGGTDLDDQPGDDGIVVLIEPQNAEGEIVPAEGKLSVAVLDPTIQPVSKARVGLWHFSPHETAELFRQSQAGRGVRLELKWPDKPPTNSDLKLYVRLLTPEGQQLVARRSLQIDVQDTFVSHDPKTPESAVDRPLFRRSPTSSPNRTHSTSENDDTDLRWTASKRGSAPARIDEEEDSVDAPPVRSARADDKSTPEDFPRQVGRRPSWSPTR